jgi:flagellar protein FlgJ
MSQSAFAGAKVYTDFQGLHTMRHNSDTGSVKKEVAQQFESILMQMVLNSMRNANKALIGDGMCSSEQMGMYQDLYDKQLTLMLSSSESSFAKLVERSIDQMQSNLAPEENTAVSYTHSVQQQDRTIRDITAKVKKEEVVLNPISSIAPKKEAESFKTPEDFVTKLWSSAKFAASLIGAIPEVLLAQAALETNWGKNILSNHSASSYSLFNIKADDSWKQKVVPMDSLEERNGVLVKEKSNFRSYGSYMDSFLDYVDFLKNNKRYSESLNKASNPKEFVQSLQNAGYATDHNYADKIIKIFSSRMFQNLITKLKTSA